LYGRKKTNSKEVELVYTFVWINFDQPSSTMRCWPTRPQRDMTVGASVSVTKECTRLRGPYLSIQSPIKRVILRRHLGLGHISILLLALGSLPTL
jgi:hypothetical protein